MRKLSLKLTNALILCRDGWQLLLQAYRQSWVAGAMLCGRRWERWQYRTKIDQDQINIWYKIDKVRKTIFVLTMEWSFYHFLCIKFYRRISIFSSPRSDKSRGDTAWAAVVLSRQSCKISIFTQIISVQLNLPPKKHVNRDKFLTFKVLNGHKKQILGQKLYLEDCFVEKCHCSL